MEYTQGYGELIIKFEKGQKPYLMPADDSGDMRKVLADALEFVKLYIKDDISLRGVKGLDFVLHPHMSLRELIQDYENKLAMKMQRQKINEESLFHK